MFAVAIISLYGNALDRVETADPPFEGKILPLLEVAAVFEDVETIPDSTLEALIIAEDEVNELLVVETDEEAEDEEKESVDKWLDDDVKLPTLEVIEDELVYNALSKTARGNIAN
jgi:hypothetical protein